MQAIHIKTKLPFTVRKKLIYDATICMRDNYCMFGSKERIRLKIQFIGGFEIEIRETKLYLQTNLI